MQMASVTPAVGETDVLPQAKGKRQLVRDRPERLSSRYYCGVVGSAEQQCTAGVNLRLFLRSTALEACGRLSAPASSSHHLLYERMPDTALCSDCHSREATWSVKEASALDLDSLELYLPGFSRPSVKLEWVCLWKPALSVHKVSAFKWGLIVLILMAFLG